MKTWLDLVDQVSDTSILSVNQSKLLVDKLIRGMSTIGCNHHTLSKHMVDYRFEIESRGSNPNSFIGYFIQPDDSKPEKPEEVPATAELANALESLALLHLRYDLQGIVLSWSMIPQSASRHSITTVTFPEDWENEPVVLDLNKTDSFTL